jgi:predicted DNA-binding protein
VALNPLDRVRNTRPGDLVCTVSARITQAEADALAALAQRNGCSKAALMRELLRDGLKQLLEA